MGRWIAIVAMASVLLFGWNPLGEAAEPLERPDVMPLAHIKPGMRGTLKTVVEGTRVESFDVDILGVLPDAGPQGDLVLIRVSEELAQRAGGIAAGMSGSPVYVGDRLVGAVGYGFPLTDHRLGLVTPIEQMLKLYDHLAPAAAEPSLEPLLEPSLRDDSEEPGQPEALPEVVIPEEVTVEAAVPIQTPLYAAGMSRRALQRLEEELGRHGFVVSPLGAGSMAGQKLERGTFEPGSAFTIQLARGDVDLYAAGTVTHVDGDRFIALGHPFTHRGETSFLASEGYVHHVVTNLLSPFKIVSPLGTVGTVRQDRGTGVAGRLGEELPLVRLNVRVHDRDKGTHHVYQAEVVQDEQWLTQLVSAVAFSGVDRALDRQGRGTARLRFRVNGDGLPRPVEWTNLAFSEFDAAAVGLFELLETVRILMDNPFAPVRLTDIDVELEIEEARHTAQIERARPLPRRVRAGDTVEVDVTLRPFRQEVIRKRVALEVPEDALPGPVGVVVRAGGWGGDPGANHDQNQADSPDSITSLSGLLDRLDERERFNDLVVEFYPPRRSEGFAPYGPIGPWDGLQNGAEPDDDDPDGAPAPPWPGPPGRFPSGEGGYGDGEPWNGFDGAAERVFARETTPYVLTGTVSFDLVITDPDVLWLPPDPPALAPF